MARLRATLAVARGVSGGVQALLRGRTLLAVLAIAFGVALGLAVEIINRAAVNELATSLATLSGQADLQVRGVLVAIGVVELLAEGAGAVEDRRMRHAAADFSVAGGIAGMVGNRHADVAIDARADREVEDAERSEDPHSYMLIDDRCRWPAKPVERETCCNRR